MSEIPCPVHTVKCKFKEVRDGELVFYYGYMNTLMKGREDIFTRADCEAMVKNGAQANASDIVKYNAEQSRRAIAALVS